MRFIGSKGGAGVAQQIISQMPPHSMFVELFAGTGIISRIKRPAASTVVIDSDAAAPALTDPPPTVQAIHASAIAWSQKHLRAIAPDALLYADPPYLMSVRSSKRAYYAHEFATDAEHLTLLALLKTVTCQVMISGYWSQLYADTLTGWRTHTIPTTNRAGHRVTEWLWMNYPEPFALHDTRFVGRNRTDRQRIKRKAARWLANLRTMPTWERAAVVAAVDCAISRG